MFPWEEEQNIESKNKGDIANREKQARWRERHADEHRQRVRDNLEKNPGYLQEWRDKNPDKVKEYSLRQNDTEERKAYMREYMREYRKAKATEKANKSAEPDSKGSDNAD